MVISQREQAQPEQEAREDQAMPEIQSQAASDSENALKVPSTPDVGEPSVAETGPNDGPKGVSQMEIESGQSAEQAG